jgi:tetratricopeptide (TPR) repeat protein
MLDETVELADRLGDPLISGQALVAAATHTYAYAQIDDCVEFARRAVRELHDGPAQWAYATAQAFLAISLAFGGRFAELPAEIETLEEVSRRLGFGGGLMFAHRCRMLASNCVEPNPRRWMQMAEVDMELCRTYGLPWVPQAQIFYATAQSVLDELDAAIELAREATESEPPGALYGWGLGLTMLLLAYAGRADEVRALWERVQPYLPTSPDPHAIGRWNLLAMALEALWFSGEREVVARYYELIAAAPREAPMRWDGRVIDSVAGLAAAAAGRWDDAERYFAAAGEVAAALPNETDRQWVKHLHAAALLERGGEGDADRAVTLLGEALDGLTRLGLPLFVRLTQERLDRLP